jgi:hypothetical protein
MAIGFLPAYPARRERHVNLTLDKLWFIQSVEALLLEQSLL